jgi:hypothetical protein
VTLLAAGDGYEARCEDQMAAAWIAGRLLERGFQPRGLGTLDEVGRWAGTDVSLAGWGKGAETLRRERRHTDLDFVLGHVDDLDVACRYRDGEVQVVGGEPRSAPRRPAHAYAPQAETVP